MPRGEQAQGGVLSSPRALSGKSGGIGCFQAVEREGPSPWELQRVRSAQPKGVRGTPLAMLKVSLQVQTCIPGVKGLRESWGESLRE